MARSVSPEALTLPAEDANAALDAAGQALFRLGRLFGRQPLADLLDGRAGRPVELSRILVVQAVADASGPAAPGGGPAASTERDHDLTGRTEVTVGAVAERLGIDPSTASRLVAETVRDGYLFRSTSALDARRACLVLTEAGRALDAGSRRYQRAVFDQATHGWSESEREAFARLFVRFATAVAEHPDLNVAAPDASERASDDAPLHDDRHA